MLANSDDFDFLNLQTSVSKRYLAYDPKTKEAFIKLDGIPLCIGQRLSELLSDLLTPSSSLCQFLLSEGYSYSLIVQYTQTQFPAEVFNAILRFKGDIEPFVTKQPNPIAKTFLKLFGKFGITEAIKGILGYKEAHTLQPTEIAKGLMLPGKKAPYRSAIYKDILQPNWEAFYGVKLFEVTEVDGKKHVNLDHGYTLFVMFIKSLGEAFLEVYDEYNPRRDGSKFRVKTFSQIIGDSEHLYAAVIERAAAISRIMYEVGQEYGLQTALVRHQDGVISDEDIKQLRINARAKLFRRLKRELPTIEEVVLERIAYDFQNGKTLDLLLPDEEDDGDNNPPLLPPAND